MREKKPREREGPGPSLFAAQFWSRNYREGAEKLYLKLEAGTVESEQIVQLLEDRIEAEHAMVRALTKDDFGYEKKSEDPRSGFGFDDGAGLKQAFDVILGSQMREARLRRKLGNDLERLVSRCRPWFEAHRGRVLSSKKMVLGAVHSYEVERESVLRKRKMHTEACRHIDEILDECEMSRGAAYVSAYRERHPFEELLHASSVYSRPEPALRMPATSFLGHTTNGLRQNVTSLGRTLSVTLSRRSTSAAAKRGSLAPLREAEPSLAPSERGKYVLDDEGNRIELPAPPSELIEDEAEAVHDSQEEAFKHKLDAARAAASRAGKDCQETLAGVEKRRHFLEELMEDHFTHLEKDEIERVRVSKAAFDAFLMGVSNLARVLSDMSVAFEGTDAVVPHNEIRAITERYRTGPFRPTPVVSFGLEDRSAAFDLLLSHLDGLYESMPVDEVRRAWVQILPLSRVHAPLRVLQSVLKTETVASTSAAFDTFTLAELTGALRLWLLEMDPPLFSYTTYDHIKNIFPSVGAYTESEELSDELCLVLSKLAPNHFALVEALIMHLARLNGGALAEKKEMSNGTADSSEKEAGTPETASQDAAKPVSGEDEPTPFAKDVGLVFGSSIVRPQMETSRSLNERFSAVFVTYLITHADSIIHAARQAMKENRPRLPKPVRQRTKPVDERVTRGAVLSHAASPPLQPQSQPPPPHTASPRLGGRHLGKRASLSYIKTAPDASV